MILKLLSETIRYIFQTLTFYTGIISKIESTSYIADQGKNWFNCPTQHSQFFIQRWLFIVIVNFHMHDKMEEKHITFFRNWGKPFVMSFPFSMGDQNLGNVIVSLTLTINIHLHRYKFRTNVVKPMNIFWIFSSLNDSRSVSLVAPDSVSLKCYLKQIFSAIKPLPSANVNYI